MLKRMISCCLLSCNYDTSPLIYQKFQFVWDDWMLLAMQYVRRSQLSIKCMTIRVSLVNSFLTILSYVNYLSRFSTTLISTSAAYPLALYSFLTNLSQFYLSHIELNIVLGFYFWLNTCDDHSILMKYLFGLSPLPLHLSHISSSVSPFLISEQEIQDWRNDHLDISLPSIG